MAVYVEKWDGDDPGDPPSDWSAVLGTSNITAKVVEVDELLGLNRALEIDSSTSDLRVFKWDTPGNNADVDVLLAVEFPDHEPGDSVEIWLRGGGTDASTLRGYVLRVEVVDAQTHAVTLHRQQGATRTELSRTFYSTEDRPRRWLRCAIRDDTIYWDSDSYDDFPVWTLADEEWWDWARSVTDTAITDPGWVGIGSTSTGVKIVRPIGLGTGQYEPPLPIGPPPEHEEPAQFRFDFKNDTPGQPPAGWEIDGWDYDKDDEPEVIVTDEGTLRLRSKDAEALLYPLNPALLDVYDLDIVFRWRFSGERVVGINGFLGELTVGGMWTGKNYGANLYVYGPSAWWDDWDFDNDEPTRPPLDPNTWYCTRIRIAGDELAAVHWQADDPPPEEWDGQVQDPIKPYFSGRVGLEFWLYDETAPATIEVDYIGIGIGGAPAPMPDLGPVSVTAQTRRVLNVAAAAHGQTRRALSAVVDVAGQTRRRLTELVTTTGQTRRILTALATALAQTRRQLHALAAVAVAGQTRRRLQAAIDVFGQTRRRLGVFISTLGQTRRRLTAAVATLGQTRRRLVSIVQALAQTLRVLKGPANWVYRNWKHDELDEQPPNTTVILDTSGGQITWRVKEKDGQRVLEMTAPPNAAGALAIDDAGENVADVDIVMRARTTSYSIAPSILARLTQDFTQGYSLGLVRLDDEYLMLASASGQLGMVPYTWSPGTYYWLELSCQGTTIRARVWPDGDPPPDWMIVVQDNSHASGLVAISGLMTMSSGQGVIIDYAFIGIGLNGAGAPMPAEVAGQARRVLVGAVATLAQTLRRLTSPSAVVGQTRRSLFATVSRLWQTRRRAFDPRFKRVPPPDTTWIPVGPTSIERNER